MENKQNKNQNETQNEIEVISNYNIYTKLQKLRKDFHSLNLKKSGENKYAGFKYFELKDFLKEAVILLEKYNLTTIMETNEEGAALILINCDNATEQIIFKIPDANCKLSGATDIQTLGAKITYQKRYLYINLLDICENDTLDSVMGKEGNTNNANYKLSEKQINRLYALANKINLKQEQVNKQLKDVFNKTVNDLTKDEYERVCNGYINKAKELNIN